MSASCACAQDKKPEEKEAPRVLVAAPLAVVPGPMGRVTLRGTNLDQATEVRVMAEGAVAKILSKGKINVPPKQDPLRVGSSQVEVELALPATLTAESVLLTVVTPAGETPAFALRILAAEAVLAEQEPNNGFRQAQRLETGRAVLGTIHEPRNVDVYRFDGKAGQRVVCEVVAARYGSGLDAMLTLYDDRGRTLAASDDVPAGDNKASSTDSHFEHTLPADGVYYLSVIDAHDEGGSAHGYMLRVK